MKGSGRQALLALALFCMLGALAGGCVRSKPPRALVSPTIFPADARSDAVAQQKVGQAASMAYPDPSATSRVATPTPSMIPPSPTTQPTATPSLPPTMSAATATELGAKGVRRQPWANEPFIAGPLADYMDAQFTFFNSSKLESKPILAGLNYFLTHGARGGEGTKLLGEKRDVKVWLGWLEQRAHGDVDAIETPIGFIPKYEDLKELFAGIDKEYSKELYDKQFSFYVDSILGRIALQEEAYGKEENLPPVLFEVYEEQRKGLEALKAKYGAIVSVEQLIEAASK